MVSPTANFVHARVHDERNVRSYVRKRENKFPPLAKHIAYINGLPVASLMSLAHSLLISATTFSGIAI